MKMVNFKIGTACLAVLLFAAAGAYSAVAFETVKILSQGAIGRSVLKKNIFTSELVIFDCATTGRMGGCFTRKP